jgi:hypothetical protein
VIVPSPFDIASSSDNVNETRAAMLVLVASSLSGQHGSHDCYHSGTENNPSQRLSTAWSYRILDVRDVRRSAYLKRQWMAIVHGPCSAETLADLGMFRSVRSV